MEIRGLGTILLVTGVILVLCGLLFLTFPQIIGKLGHLPGDIRWERNGVRVYIPITTMILLSLLLTLLFNLIFRGKG
jgi:uncharacterized membrane protein